MSAASEEPGGDIIFSIGHSNQPAEQFVAHLQEAGIQLVLDCRSAPYSAYSTQFNREDLAATLTAAGIRYLYAGDDLGGRPGSDAGEHPDYAEMAQRDAFREGLARLQRLAEEQSLCVLCSEEDPRRCHRSLLIGHELLAQGVDVRHLRRDGREERQSELEREATQQLSLF